jgi:hypothetical protein
MFLNGTLNVTPEIAQANLPIRERRGVREGESFLELLDRLGIDVFIGIHLPQTPPGRRPWYRTTAHLEDAPGWILAFRNLRSAVYLRDAEQNAENLERIAAYYAERGVPFAPATGFDPTRVLREAPGWALRHGLAPRHYPQLGGLSLQLDSHGDRALEELAAIFASLGDYERAAAAARRRLDRGESLAARRYLVWSLLQLDRGDEAREAATALASLPAAGALGQALAATVERFATLDPDAAVALQARMPVLTRREAMMLLRRTVQAGARPPRALRP